MWADLEQVVFQLQAVFYNLVDWFLIGFLRQWWRVQPPNEVDDLKMSKHGYCIIILRPGSVHQVRHLGLKADECTVGYNLPGFSRKNAPVLKFRKPGKEDGKEEGDPAPGVAVADGSVELPPDAVLLKTTYFSVNYADVCIRWGLYDSANKFVGWPICPGFDVSGEVEWAGEQSGFKEGDKVFGVTMFGGYSSRVLVPARQLRMVPEVPADDGSKAALSLHAAASVPAVASTALHALSLAGFWPRAPLLQNRAVLVHSAAGGVGSVLCCMARHFGASEVVGVVGRKGKLAELRALKIPTVENAEDGMVECCDRVILKQDLWTGRELSDADGAENSANASAPQNDFSRADSSATGGLRLRKGRATSPGGSAKPNFDAAPTSYSEAVNEVNRSKFAAIFDANGVETLQKSYDHLAQSGRLVVYGFHTNLPTSNAEATLMLNPLQWLRMAWKLVAGMPRFDPMMMTLGSKAVLGFNLSFFAEETDLLAEYFREIVSLLERGVIRVPLGRAEDMGQAEAGRLRVTVLNDVRHAHELLSSAQTTGKLVVRV